MITFLGHVDHGKTSLFDRIIGIDVVSGESGGITQHIRAYQIEKDGRKISFVDTPGHEAFTEMRARGANVTDIAVLVVAADDGVMPQTEEAISHAQAAGVPIVVALNKIDLPGVDAQRILPATGRQRTAADRVGRRHRSGQNQRHAPAPASTNCWKRCSRWPNCTTTGPIPHRPASRHLPGSRTARGPRRGGQADRAKRHAQGRRRRGLRLGLRPRQGHVRHAASQRARTHEAGPSHAGQRHGSERGARRPASTSTCWTTSPRPAQIAEKREGKSRRAALGGAPEHVTLENLFDRLGQKEVQTLNIILRADVRGSIEAIQKELTKLEHPEVKIKMLQATVGGITEADVHLADASDAIIIGFNVVPDEKARTLAERARRAGSPLRHHLQADRRPEGGPGRHARARAARSRAGPRPGAAHVHDQPRRHDRRLPRAVRQRSSAMRRVRLIRENRIIGDYALDSLKREKDDAREVREGLECGIKLGGFNDLKEGDILEVYKVEEIARTF